LPFSEASLSLTDILDAIVAIEQFTQDMDLDSFRQDPKTIAAVERKLQVISEAAVRLGEQAEALCPGLPWRDIRIITPTHPDRVNRVLPARSAHYCRTSEPLRAVRRPQSTRH
jgi:ribonuclease HepT-like protein